MTDRFLGANGKGYTLSRDLAPNADAATAKEPLPLNEAVAAAIWDEHERASFGRGSRVPFAKASARQQEMYRSMAQKAIKLCWAAFLDGAS